MTPDSLGPRVVDNLQMTRHFLGEYGEDFCERNDLPVLSGIIPGVMAQTGMETAEIVKGVVDETKPDMVLAIDCLLYTSSAFKGDRRNRAWTGDYEKHRDITPGSH